MRRLIRSRILAAIAGAAAIAALLPPAGPATAGSDSWFRPVDDPKVKAECGACHMAFPAGMLPARSWEAVMDRLADHFGEDASLDDAARKAITEWLVTNAARPRADVTRGLAAGDAPLRITETPWWLAEHRGEVRPGAFQDPKVGSKANCAACHRDAARGSFEDD